MSAAPPAGHRTGANRWERGTLWLSHVDPPPAVEGPWPPLASDPDAFTTFARDLGADERYQFRDVLDVDAPPKRALAFVVCYPTGGSVAEAILPLFSTAPSDLNLMIIKLEADTNLWFGLSNVPDSVAIFTAVSSVRPPPKI